MPDLIPLPTNGELPQLGRVIRDPKLLPYFLTLDQVSAVCQLSTRTIQTYCQDGTWTRGVHWTQPRRKRRYLRDAVLNWLSELDRQALPPPKKPSPCRANVRHSPELAAIIEREAANGV